MFRKTLFTLFLLSGIVLLASCSPNSGSPAQAANLPNPASVNCEQNGGKLELRQDASGGVAGVCIFPDGSECDEWAYLRGECKPGDSLATPEPVIPAIASPSPTPKPSVLRIAYFKDGYVMLWTKGEGSRQLTQASTEQMRISDDGQVIAYLGSDPQGTTGIFAMEADGSNPRLLVGQDYLQNIQSAGQVVSFDFAPSSQMLYFVTDQYDLHRVDAAASGSPVPVFEAGAGGFFSFSPDGQWMTLYHPNQLVLAHSDGSDARVAFEYPGDFSYTMKGPQVIWEPDSLGFRIASASGPQGSPDSMTVWRVPVQGDPVKQMSYAGPYGADLSPDGIKVVYFYSQHDPIDVHVVAQDGQDTTYDSFSSTTYVNLNFMGWTPDSKYFLLNLSDDGRLQNPWLCAPGEQPVKLTDTQYAYAVNWVDADRFLFISEVELRLQRPGEPSMLVDTIHSSGYDYTFIAP